MRAILLLGCLVVGLATTAQLACTSAFTTSPTSGTGGAGGQGGGGGSSSTTTTTGTATSVCMSDGDCPPPTSQCAQARCLQGACDFVPLPAGAVPDPIVGNCKAEVCDGAGNQTSTPDPSDVYDDGNPCTQDSCVNSVPQNSPTPGKTCDFDGGRVCDDMGACVQCLKDNDCPSQSTQFCQNEVCVLNHCKDGMPDDGETDTDCGGPECAPCSVGNGCVHGSDCTTGVCGNGTPHLCQQASCTDGVMNGDETDKDCGGSCPPCGDNKQCKTGADCTSKVCTTGTCSAPSCTDGIQNGNETDKDCGGSCPGCPDTENCNGPMDCLSNGCNPQGKCDVCFNGVQDPGETDVDCGGTCTMKGETETCANNKKCVTNSDCTSGRCCTAITATSGNGSSGPGSGSGSGNGGGSGTTSGRCSNVICG